MTEAYELATAALRGDPARRPDIDRLSLAERLMVRAFSLRREEHFHAMGLFHEALARDPYHPGGRYDLACVLAGAGDRLGAGVALLAAIRDGGGERLAARAAIDPDLAGLDLPAGELARAVHGGSHCLSVFQVRPEHDGSIRFRVRPELREQAYEESLGLSVSDVLGALRGRPDPLDPRSYRDSARPVEEFELCMYADRSYFRGWDLHCALRRLAPFVEDAQGFVWDWNVGGYLDEIAVVDGELTILRQYTGYSDPGSREDLLRERVRRSPGDRLLAEAVAAEFG
ncbi:hypothetical protein ACFPIJ_08365 [Dactylosporangium cerinum]|uniref:Tetratricopeptide repeat protein n=1 Tax=Dactylosporangium cerinum TaxID=1434730 RepID=A0ABV9VNA0_9ACTN